MYGEIIVMFGLFFPVLIKPAAIKDCSAQFCNIFDCKCLDFYTADVAKVKRLIAQGQPINLHCRWSRYCCGGTPLIGAARVGHADSVKVLLDAKALVNEKDRYGQTALMYAVAWHNAYNNSGEKIKKLLVAGASVNEQSENGQTALMIAASGKRIDVVRRLLEAQALVNIQDNQGMTALMQVVKEPSSKKQSDLIRILMRAGARTDLKYESGSTVFDVAPPAAQEIMHKVIPIKVLVYREVGNCLNGVSVLVDLVFDYVGVLQDNKRNSCCLQ